MKRLFRKRNKIDALTRLVVDMNKNMSYYGQTFYEENFKSINSILGEDYALSDDEINNLNDMQIEPICHLYESSFIIRNYNTLKYGVANLKTRKIILKIDFCDIQKDFDTYVANGVIINCLDDCNELYCYKINDIAQAFDEEITKSIFIDNIAKKHSLTNDMHINEYSSLDESQISSKDKILSKYENLNESSIIAEGVIKSNKSTSNTVGITKEVI